MLIFILPLTILSIASYLSFFFFKSSSLSLVFFNVVGILLSLIVLKKSFKTELIFLKELFDQKKLILVASILAVVSIKALVLSPFILTKTVNSSEYIRLTPVGDYYKDTFFTSSLAQDGISPKNPYFPLSNLSYYLGYYLFPSSLVNIFNLPAHITFYIFSLVTDLLSFLLILEIILKVFKKSRYQILTLALIFTGVGVDSIPYVFNTLGQGHSNQGLQLNNIYDALLFVPQHFLPAAVVVWTVFRLLEKNLNLISLTILSVFIILSSIFVSLVYIFWLTLLFISQKEHRKKLLYTGFLATILLIPNLIYLSDRTNLFYHYQFEPYSFTDDYLINVLYSFFIKYGPFLLLFPLLLLFNLKKIRLISLLALTLPLIITWFVRTPNFNDFSRKTSIPMQFALAIVYIYFLQFIKSNTIKTIFILLTVGTILIGTWGFYLDYSGQWKARTILHPKDSELIFKIRSLPKASSLAAVDRSRWVELIPSLAFKKVFTPYLFDSSDYLIRGKISEEHGAHESQAVSLFIEPAQARDLTTLIENKNSELKLLNQFFSRYPKDLLIVNNNIWIKKDTNPWLVILKKLGVKFENLTPNFTGFDYADLLTRTTAGSVSIDQAEGKKIAVLGRTVFLPQGLQFLATCRNSFPSDTNLEFEDYNVIFHKTIQASSFACIGQFFYLEGPQNVLLSGSSNVDYIYSFPVEISARKSSAIPAN